MTLIEAENIDAGSKPIETNKPPYTMLAAGYDVVMRHVDYEDWADYLYDLIETFHPSARTILELGCGTGSLALALQPMGNFAYAGTDMAPAMVHVAREKALLAGLSVQFEVADFTNFQVDPPVDVALLVHDGLNYLYALPEIEAMLWAVHRALKPGGLFIFDQSTPANSINNEAFFKDEGGAGDFHYIRQSHYDPQQQIHCTEFELTVEGETFYEHHVQRAYRMDEIKPILARLPFEILAIYDCFTGAPATKDTERPHWVLRWHNAK